MGDIILKIDNVKKQYRLGEIGGTTLRDELQRINARIHGREDPTKRIGAKNYNKGETFYALNGVSFEVKTGERVGIIGHNGAGKSTLLKLISRVTVPTSGSIGLNGRVASMLEVGTGFHPELTGRENIYMNGAILGMTKAEIDRKMEEIIEFSECRQFIDTPVKRYSSGMYVKLAFSVAAHLDSEIMIMDEVLAVGDMAFQKKCIKKMGDVSKTQGRTILYVSHNMNTIRQLCDRVVVLDHGKVVFDGDVEDGISHYLGIEETNDLIIDYTMIPRLSWLSNTKVRITRAQFVGAKDTNFTRTSKLHFRLIWKNEQDVKNICFRLEILKPDREPIGISVLNDFYSGKKSEEGTVDILFEPGYLAPGKYTTNFTFYERSSDGSNIDIDCVHGLYFSIIDNGSTGDALVWQEKNWGAIVFPNLQVIN